MSGPYIQSGNVLFRADPALAEDIPFLISASILSRFGYRVPVVARTARELQEIVQAQPLRGSWSRSEQAARPLPGGTTRPGAR